MSSKALSVEHVLDSSDEAVSSPNGAETHNRKSHTQRQRSAKRQKLTPPREKVNERGTESRHTGNLEGSENSVSRGNSSGRSESSVDGIDTGADSTSATPNSNIHSTRDLTSPSPIQPPSTPAPWQPPGGFEAVPEVSHDSHWLTQLFTVDDSIAGKELWHITVPASVPIEALSEVVLDHVNSVGAALFHKGINYAFVREEKQTDDTSFLLIPNDECVSYRPAKTKFAQTICLQQADLSQPYLPPARDSAAPLTHKSRSQPKGLRTRFWPSGFEENNNELVADRSISPDIDTGTASSVDDSTSSSSDSSSEEEEDEGTSTRGEPPNDKSITSTDQKKISHKPEQESQSSLARSESEVSSSTSDSDSESSSSE